MKVESINIGLPQTVNWHNREITTGIFKMPTPGPHQVRTLNIDGDGVADLNVHGGQDKAVYAYSADHYPWWIEQFPNSDHRPGMLGVNLTVSGLNEREVFVGDVYKLGSCQLMGIQPREPCFKFNIRMNHADAMRRFLEQDFSGVYFRVLKEGAIKAGDELVLVSRPQFFVSIFNLFDLARKRFVCAPEEARQYLQCDYLTERWQKKISANL